MGIRSIGWLGLSLVMGCSISGGRGREGTVPTQPALPPLPEFVEICISKAVVLPAKMDGKSWDGIGRIGRKSRKLIPDLAAAAQTGGYSAALSAAGAVGTSVFNKVKGPPDLRVQMQLGRDFIIRTDQVKDSTIAAFGANEASCAVIERKEYSERVQFVVEDLDVGKPEVAGSKSLVGIPVEAIQSGTWQVFGFDSVVEIELTLQPMEKRKNRKSLPQETAPPTVPDGPEPQPAPAEAPAPAEPGAETPEPALDDPFS